LSASRITRRVFVTAISGGTPILDLTATDFQIVESGTTREVTGEAPGNEPMRVVLLVDSSTAVGPMLTRSPPPRHLKTEAGRFSSDGGGNSLIETPLESDRRFLGQAAWPVIVIVPTDDGDAPSGGEIKQPVQKGSTGRGNVTLMLWRRPL
jgi:hypothetical protein